MAGGGAPRRGGMITGINVTPLVDIMLVLLIIFMLTAHVIARQALEVDLPQAAQGGEVPGSPLSIQLNPDGVIHLNGEPVGPEALAAAVRAAVATDPQVQVIIAAGREVSHGRVVWVLDLVKSLQVTRFAIQIDPLATTPPTPPDPGATPTPAAGAPSAP